MTNVYRADFGKTAPDYATHRAGFPDRLFDELARRGIGGVDGIARPLLDIGTGTGTLARGFAERGMRVTGIDIAPDMLKQAQSLADRDGLELIRFAEGRAEATGQPDDHFDYVTAGQCWHWFDGPAACVEIQRVLRPGGMLTICHFDWLPIPGTVVAATEALILAHAPTWPFAGGTGLYPAWTTVMAEAGFAEIETFSFDVQQIYSHADWRGRIRASAPIGGSMTPDAVADFDAEHARMLAHQFPDDPLMILHRCWAAIARWPGNQD